MNWISIENEKPKEGDVIMFPEEGGDLVWVTEWVDSDESQYCHHPHLGDRVVVTNNITLWRPYPKHPKKCVFKACDKDGVFDMTGYGMKCCNEHKHFYQQSGLVGKDK